mmetsp:Transcript_3043/g.6019  ORF Transcript_3043/g.6019 Transcript_3043/m.6019 type:complete len:257 (-) Transcript_3043:3035-3805(-)
MFWIRSRSFASLGPLMVRGKASRTSVSNVYSPSRSSASTLVLKMSIMHSRHTANRVFPPASLLIMELLLSMTITISLGCELATTLAPDDISWRPGPTSTAWVGIDLGFKPMIWAARASIWAMDRRGNSLHSWIITSRALSSLSSWYSATFSESSFTRSPRWCCPCNSWILNPISRFPQSRMVSTAVCGASSRAGLISLLRLSSSYCFLLSTAAHWPFLSCRAVRPRYWVQPRADLGIRMMMSRRPPCASASSSDIL